MVVMGFLYKTNRNEAIHLKFPNGLYYQVRKMIKYLFKLFNGLITGLIKVLILS